MLCQTGPMRSVLPLTVEPGPICCPPLGGQSRLSVAEAMEVSSRLGALADPARVAIVSILAGRRDHATHHARTRPSGLSHGGDRQPSPEAALGGRARDEAPRRSACSLRAQPRGDPGDRGGARRVLHRPRRVGCAPPLGRRVWDSNPRRRMTPQRFSRPSPSAARSTLLDRHCARPRLRVLLLLSEVQHVVKLPRVGGARRRR